MVTANDWTTHWQTWNDALEDSKKMTDVEKLPVVHEWTTPISSSEDITQTGRMSMIKGSIGAETVYYLGWSTQVDLLKSTLTNGQALLNWM